MSHCDWFMWHVGTWSGVSAGEVVGEVAEVVGEVAEWSARSPKWSERAKSPIFPDKAPTGGELTGESPWRR